jgi:hypothetical protein
MTILRGHAAKGKLLKNVLNFFFWTLLSVNVTLSAWTIRQNAATTQSADFGNMLLNRIPFLPVDWFIPLLLSAGMNAFTCMFAFLFLSNPKGIPIFLDTLFKNKLSKLPGIMEAGISCFIFGGLSLLVYRSYLYDLNATATALGLPTVAAGLFRHQLNMPVFFVVFGPDVISIVLNAYDEISPLILGSAPKGGQQTQRVSRGATYPSAQHFPDGDDTNM